MPAASGRRNKQAKGIGLVQNAGQTKYSVLSLDQSSDRREKQAVFTIWVVDAGKTHYVGERETRESAQAAADIYNQDPIAAGWFYVVRRETDPAVRSDVTVYGAGC